MFVLTKLLLTQRARKLRHQYGAKLIATLGVMLLLLIWKFASIAAHVVAIVPAARTAAAMQGLAVAWFAVGVLTGRDFTWHIRIDRLVAFRQPFARLYLLDQLLSFFSYPMALLFAALAFFGARSGWTAAHWITAAAAMSAFSLVIRLAVSVVRTLLHRRGALSAPQKLMVSVIVVAAGGGLFAVRLFDMHGPYLPGDALARAVFRGDVNGLSSLAIELLCLAAVDSWLQRVTIRSGISAAPAARARLGRQFVTTGNPLWRIGLLGWVRNVNVALLLLWGVSYGFTYTYLTRASGTSYFLLFCWMMLIFHSYIRANLLGVDHRAAWLHTRGPGGLEAAVMAKNSSLSTLQALMVAAVLLPAVLHRTEGMTRPIDWACVIGFAASGILLGEIGGGVFSLLHPEPIERGAMYSGAMTLGAFVLPAAQVVLVTMFLTAHAYTGRGLPRAATWIFYIGFPAFLMLLRLRALPVVLRELTRRHRDAILEKLEAVTP